MTEALLRRSSEVLGKHDYELIQKLRLAGLLHDIGHYPFSHAMQDAVGSFLAKKGDEFYEHEDLGGLILKHDAQIQQTLKAGGIDPADIASIFGRTDPDFKLANLISSDLDADRLDYLPRTSHFSGLPYGSIDLDYIVSQMCEDDEHRPCLTFKALRAADAFLLARLMDYQQVAFNKAVAAFEWLLKEVIEALLGLDDTDLNLSQGGVVELIESPRWARFTDDSIYARIDTELKSPRRFGDPVIELMAKAMLHRTTPKTVAEFYRLEEPFSPGRGAVDLYVRVQKDLKACAQRVADECKIDPRLFKVWSVRKALTKLGSRDPDKDDQDQMVRLCKPGGNSELITQDRQAICSLLARYNIEMVRAFVLLPPDKVDLRPKIQQMFSEQVEDARLP